MSDSNDVVGHSCRIQVRSYELDSFGHVNHAVYLNYFEHARLQALAAEGFPLGGLAKRGQGVHVVRVEVDYRSELKMGDEIRIQTRALEAGASSMTLSQTMLGAADSTHESPSKEGDAVHAEARVVLVWIGPNGRPMRIPSDVRLAFGLPDRRG